MVAALIFASGLALLFAGSAQRRTAWITAAALTVGIGLVARRSKIRSTPI